MRLVLILSMSLIAMAITACDSPDINGVEDPMRANLNPPDNPELCEPACQALTGETCDATAVGDDAVEVLRGCIADCLEGTFSDEELECLAAAADCESINDCL